MGPDPLGPRIPKPPNTVKLDPRDAKILAMVGDAGWSVCIHSELVWRIVEECSSPSLQSSSSFVQENFVWAAFLGSAVASSVVSEDLAMFPACAVGRDFLTFRAYSRAMRWSVPFWFKLSGSGGQ